LIAQDEAPYRRIAQRLAQDPQHLQQLRQDQRAKTAGSPVCDGTGFARSFGEMAVAIYQSRLTQTG
jgi:predicted O-linked N-acetylglucosamine transferase (SPINDLY family)